MRIVGILGERPDLAPLVARWLLDAFGRPGGPGFEELVSLVLAPPEGPEESFVLFDAAGEPVGTASLARRDLAARPDLTPWLAGVVVAPAHRGRGNATALVRHVEGFAAAAGVGRLWLYTATAEGLYARLGWHRAGLEQDHGREVVLMRRDLAPPGA